jgi:hypothetical protein
MATPATEDLAGLRHLADRIGGREQKRRESGNDRLVCHISIAMAGI